MEIMDAYKNSRPHKRLSGASSRILKDWFYTNRDNPYPSEQEKTWLKDQTGLSARQITYWFTNARRRYGKHVQDSAECSRENDFRNMSALERWRHSPPELEPASLSDIAKAIATAQESKENRPGDYSRLSSPYNSNCGEDSSAPSEVSFRWSSSDASSGSRGSASSIVRANVSGRRRRKKHVVNPTEVHAEERKYQCTFCTDSFKRKYDWTRHETTQHLCLETWSCAPFGPRIYLTGQAYQQCAFCGLPDPTDAHLHTHRYEDCAQSSERSRIFHRRDHLRQHLELFHKVGGLGSWMEDWKSTATHIKCRCGLCGETFNEWTARNEHLAQHFRNGALMKDWKGCRGLDPAIAMIVRNAMPPYLIGAESSALVPFSAEQESARQNDSIPFQRHERDSREVCPQPNSFEFLVAELGKFVNEQKLNNAALTDEMLQSKARLIVFGDDDPWNQTAADNLQWLEMFKHGHGLDTSTAFENGQACSSKDFDQSQNDALFNLPWYWQSPECLVEFRQCRADFDITLDGDFTSNPMNVTQIDPIIPDCCDARVTSFPLEGVTNCMADWGCNLPLVYDDTAWLSWLPSEIEIENVFKADSIQS